MSTYTSPTRQLAFLENKADQLPNSLPNLAAGRGNIQLWPCIVPAMLTTCCGPFCNLLKELMYKNKVLFLSKRF